MEAALYGQSTCSGALFSQKAESSGGLGAVILDADPLGGSYWTREQRSRRTAHVVLLSSRNSTVGAGVPMGTITKKDLVDRIANQTDLKRSEVRDVIQSFLDNVINELGDGNRLEFRDFGVFEIRERAARMAQNPRTLERVPVPARKTVKFKVGRLMRRAVDTDEIELEASFMGTDEMPHG